MNILEVGETETLVGEFFSTAGTLEDQAAVVLTVTAPDGTVTTPAVTHGGTGTYTHDLVLTARGVWEYRFDGDLIGETRFLLVGEASATTSGPCDEWCSVDDVTRCRSDLDGTAIPAQIEVASEIMYALSGQRYPGLCEATRTVCRDCRCRRRACCCHDRARDIDLGTGWPVAGVLSVTIDGDELTRAAYRLENARWLRRVDGDSWPLCDSGDPDNLDPLVVRWVYGRAVPPGGREAAAMLAGELTAACLGLDCKLPVRTVAATAEGMTITLVDPQAIIASGATGLYLVDLWLYIATTADVPASGSIFDPGARAAQFTDVG